MLERKNPLHLGVHETANASNVRPGSGWFCGAESSSLEIESMRKEEKGGHCEQTSGVGNGGPSPKLFHLSSPTW